MPVDSKKTVIIVDSLTKDFVGEGAHQNVKVHIGHSEVKRILGNAENNWTGPLSIFIKNAIKSQNDGQNTSIINIRDLHDPNDPVQIPELLRHGDHNLIGTEGAKLIEPISAIYNEGEIEDLPVTALSVPIVALRNAIQKVTGIDILNDKDVLNKLKFIVCGTHSNIRVFNTAQSLRWHAGCANVMVCPHLSGSNNASAHNASFKSWFPDILVRVAQSVREVCDTHGISVPSIELQSWKESCDIKPKDLCDKLNADEKAILETIFMGSDSAEIARLSGGFSGSLLLLANAQKDNAHLQATVIKIDKHAAIKREIDGYNKIKDLLGMHVPAFDLPVSMGAYTGVKIDLASLAGEPRTFQSIFEEEKNPISIPALAQNLEDILEILFKNLYKNTKKSVLVSDPFGQCTLKNPKQARWLKENIGHILISDINSDYLQLTENISIKNPIPLFNELINKYLLLEGETCLSHRDLNFANQILDKKDNIWFIDWTYADEDIVEIDFAKMENDIKFVMSKKFTENDLEKLMAFETYILSSIELPDIDVIPKELSFIKEDERFLKIYSLLKILRSTYIKLNKDIKSANILYRTALLKYSIHTLSFDKRQGKGECELPALKYSLISTSLLTDQLTNQYYAIEHA